jgi:putative nucleotidyltransferase with HDIG domain
MQKISPAVQLFLPTVVALATLLAVLLSGQVSWHEWPQMLLFFSVIVLAFSVRISEPRGGAVTPTTVLSYLLIYLFNPPTALLVAGVGRTLGYVISRGWIPWRALFNGAQIAISVAIGSFVFRLLHGDPSTIDLPRSYPAFVLAPLAHQVANNFFVAYAVSRERRTPLLSTWLIGIWGLFWQNLIHIPTAVFLTILYGRVQYVAVLGYLALLRPQLRALRLYFKQRDLLAQIVDGLVVATDVNFPISRGHARRVADIAVAVARELRISEAAVESIQFAALLHDVGMIGKDDLLERRVLAPEDAENLRDHVRIGAEIARELPRKDIDTLILHHHERYDGTGYPGGLVGESIPLGARIIALAEVVDSMARGISPYATATPTPAIEAYVVAEKGRAFDPAVVEAFEKLLTSGAIALSGADRSLERPPEANLGGASAT